MRVGTRSVLFGVHQFLWHPLTVALAFRKWHGRWPRGKAEWVAIMVHDLGYWGCDNMDGESGRRHPLQSAVIAWWTVYGLRGDRTQRMHAVSLVLGHSSFFAAQRGQPVSMLYAPDKLCVLHEPRWFYLLRGLASGEIWEYIAQAPEELSEGAKWRRPWRWVNWYRAKTWRKFYGNKARQQCENAVSSGKQHAL